MPGGVDPLLACDVTQSPTFVSICLHVNSLQLFRIQIDSKRHPRKVRFRFYVRSGIAIRADGLFVPYMHASLERLLLLLLAQR
jgi:hypothetical protein